MNNENTLKGMNRRFEFKAVNLKENDAFLVVSFEGEEAISELYRFELIVASRDGDIDEKNRWPKFYWH
jgi:uncharacterized protein involved in type VI secretion and phage assembly